MKCSCRPPEALAGALGGWETTAGESRYTIQRELGYRVFLGYGGVKEERETTGEEVGDLLASVESGWERLGVGRV